MQLKIFMTYYILQSELDSNLIDFYPALTFLLITHSYHFSNLNYIMFLSIQHIILLNLKILYEKGFLLLLNAFNHFSKICTIPCFPANFSSPCFVLYGYNCKKTPHPDSIFYYAYGFLDIHK